MEAFQRNIRRGSSGRRVNHSRFFDYRAISLDAFGETTAKIVENRGQFIYIDFDGLSRGGAVAPALDDMGDGAHFLADLQKGPRRRKQEVAKGAGRLLCN